MAVPRPVKRRKWSDFLVFLLRKKHINSVLKAANASRARAPGPNNFLPKWFAELFSSSLSPWWCRISVLAATTTTWSRDADWSGIRDRLREWNVYAESDVKGNFRTKTWPSVKRIWNLVRLWIRIPANLILAKIVENACSSSSEGFAANARGQTSMEHSARKHVLTRWAPMHLVTKTPTSHWNASRSKPWTNHHAFSRKMYIFFRLFFNYILLLTTKTFRKIRWLRITTHYEEEIMR